MFLLFFLIFTLVFTVFQNIQIAGISLVLVIIFLTIYQFISKKEILCRQIIFSLLGGFLLAIAAFGIKEIRYYGGIERWIPAATLDPVASTGQAVGMRYNGNGNTFVGTGIISDISGQGKYIFSYKNTDYLLYSEKKYTIGDVIWLVGNMDSGQIPARFRLQHLTPEGRAGMRGRKYRTISSGTFSIPIFSGDFDYGKRLKMKGRQGTIYEKNSIIMNNEKGIMNNDRIGFIHSMKKSIQQKVIRAYGENKASGLILGMLIGDKSQIPETEYQQFIDSGLVHLIAVSGGNILMIVVFLQCILFFLPFYIRIGCILLTIIGYSLICGLDSSVFRAMLMGGLSMVALFRGREINIRRLLSISVIIMLIINPYFLAYDTGFLLSYSALIGIVYFDTLKNEKKENVDSGRKTGRRNDGRVGRGLQYVYKTYISPSIGASIGIFPIIVFFMGKINLVSIIGNLLVLPLVPFVMIYGFVSVCLYSWLGWGWILWIEQFLVNYIYKISELLAQYGIFLQISGLRVKYLILLIFLGIFIARKTRKGES